MHSYKFLRFEIQNRMNHLPDAQLEELKKFVDALGSKSSRKPKPATLRGIWQAKGFENIGNLDEVVRDVRKELDEQILRKNN